MNEAEESDIMPGLSGESDDDCLESHSFDIMPGLSSESDDDCFESHSHDDDDSDAEYLDPVDQVDLMNLDAATSKVTVPSSDPEHDANILDHIVEPGASDIRDDAGDDHDASRVQQTVASDPDRDSADEDASTDADDCDDQPGDYGDAKVVHIFADTLLGVGAMRRTPVKDALMAVDLDDEHHGDLIDDHAWRLLETQLKQMRTRLLLSPPSSTFRDEAICDIPAMRSVAEGKLAVHRDLPRDRKDELKVEDLLWTRASALCSWACSAGVPWGVFYHAQGEAQPLLLLGWRTLLKRSGVTSHIITLNTMVVVAVTNSSFSPRASYNSLDSFCAHFADSLLMSEAGSPVAPCAPTHDAPSAWRGELQWRDRLRPPEADDMNLEGFVGGLRSSNAALKMVPSMRAVGKKISEALDILLLARPRIKQVFQEAISKKCADHPGLEEAGLEVARSIGAVVGCSDFRRGLETGLDCEVRVSLIKAWRQASGDPDDQIEVWFGEGAPMGITQMPLPRGIFPLYTELEASRSPSSLLSEDLQGESMPADDVDKAADDLKPMVKRGWIRRFTSKHAAKRYVRGRIVLSKLVVIAKEKRYKYGNGVVRAKLKRRLILDLKQPGASAVSVKCE